MERYGADALRWVLLTSGSPWSSRRLGDTVLEEAVRQFLLTLWHVYSFFVLYANADVFDPDAEPGSASVLPTAAGPMDPVSTRRHRSRGSGRDGRLRRDGSRSADPGVRRGPVELVRAALAPSVLEPGWEWRRRQRRRVPHAARVPGHRGDAARAAHPVRLRGDLVEPRRRARRAAGLRAPRGLSAGGRGGGRPRSGRRDGARASGRGARAADPHGDQDPNAPTASRRGGASRRTRRDRSIDCGIRSPRS